MPTLRADQLKNVYRAFLQKLGASNDEAETFADMFVMADLRGVEIQGVKSLNRHVIGHVRKGRIRLGREIRVVKETPASAVLDADNELGQVACKKAMELAIKKAKESGVGLVSMRNSGDTGILASYPKIALEHECIGLMFNTSHPFVAPWGGNERVLGTDPISVAIPAGKERPVIVDMSVTPIKEQYDTKTAWLPPFAVPPLYHFATVREYALTVVLELLAGALAGMPIGKDNAQRGIESVFCMAIHIPHFIPIEDFRGRVDRYVAQVKSSQLADGVSEILMPGEREFREQEKRLREGIPVPESVWDDLRMLADELGVDLKKATSST